MEVVANRGLSRVLTEIVMIDLSSLNCGDLVLLDSWLPANASRFGIRPSLGWTFSALRSLKGSKVVELSGVEGAFGLSLPPIQESDLGAEGGPV